MAFYSILDHFPGEVSVLSFSSPRCHFLCDQNISMNARQAVTQGRSMSDHREVRSGDPEAGFGSKLAVLSQGRSGSRGRRHFSRDSPTEIHMKVRAVVASQNLTLTIIRFPDRCTQGSFQPE